MSSGIQRIHDLDKLRYVHNMSVSYISEFLSLPNCHGDLPTSFVALLMDDLHKKNDMKSEFYYEPDIIYNDLISYKLKFYSLNLKKNLKTFSHGYLFTNRSTKKCFGIIY